MADSGVSPPLHSAADDRDAERRAHRRLRSRTLADGTMEAAGDRAGRSFLGTTIDLSAQGALIRTYETLESGDRVRLKLHLPEGDLTVGGELRHLRVDTVGCRIAGVNFISGAESPVLARHLAAMVATAGQARSVLPWKFEGELTPS